MASIGLCLNGMVACRDLTAKLPAGYIDPSFYTTPEAAEQMARNVRFAFQKSLFDFMLDAGAVTDEFLPNVSDNHRISGNYTEVIILESRFFPDFAMEESNSNLRRLVDQSTYVYRDMQQIRSRAVLARGALQKYAPESPLVLQGELSAYEGFAEVILADLYCSGIPLSVIEFEGDFQYRYGSRTGEVYGHAITLFDTAIALAGSDVYVRRLAQIGKGRALLAIGRYQDAALAVADIPDDYVFDLPLMYGAGTSDKPTSVNWLPGIGGDFRITSRAQIADLKGGNGLNFLSAEDPRIKRTTYVSGSGNNQRVTSYPATILRVVVANALEARLIEAESALHDGDPQWLDRLNALRTDGTVTVDGDGNVHYGAGIGGVSDLAPLTDPGIAALPPGKTALDVRVDLVMRERAFWLFFRGIRQGDLRRLIRNYDRKVENVYPYGDYVGGAGVYGDYVDIPIPQTERPNPYFTGCLGRGE